MLLSNHPQSRYFEGGLQAKTIANREYPLWQVVRASTAAPYFFDPETVCMRCGSASAKPIDSDFVDGGVSPHNNPTLQALMTATMPGYRFVSLKALMEDYADQVEAMMQWQSLSPTAREIDRDIGRVDTPLTGNPLCSHLRYNVLLTSDWIEKDLGAWCR